jgi:hypothetical protein
MAAAIARGKGNEKGQGSMGPPFLIRSLVHRLAGGRTNPMKILSILMAITLFLLVACAGKAIPTGTARPP